MNIQNGIAPIAYEYSISAWREENRKQFLDTRYDYILIWYKKILCNPQKLIDQISNTFFYILDNHLQHMEFKYSLWYN